MNRVRAAALVGCLAVFACTESLSPEDYYGVWGGDGARLTLSITRALFETSCWTGELGVPIQVDDEKFTAIGNIQSQGGAVGGNETRAVILFGRLDGDVMRLTVETSPALGPYNLRRGANVSIPGCP